MESKRRGGKKRVRENDSGGNAETEEKIMHSSKKRKSTLSNSIAPNVKKNNKAKATSSLGLETSEKALTFCDDDDSNFSVGSSSTKEFNTQIGCLASHVRKTYGGSSSSRQSRKERSRGRGSLAAKMTHNVEDQGNNVGTLGSRSSVAVSESNPDVHFATSMSNRLGNDTCSRSSEDILEGPAIDDVSSPQKSNSNGNECGTTLQNSRNKRRKSEQRGKSNSGASQEEVSSSAQQSMLSPGDVTSVVFSTLPSQPILLATSAACPIATASCHSNNMGVSYISSQNMYAGVTAINSLSLPIISLPSIPNITQVVHQPIESSVTTLDSDPQPTSNSQPQVSHQESNGSSVENSASNSRSHDHSAIPHIENNCSVATSDPQDGKIPLISIDDDCDPLSVDKSFDSLTSDSNMAKSKSLTNCDGMSNSDTRGSDAEGNHNIVTTLKVDNWASYLLQRLEMLFDREEKCDLILKFSSGEVLKAHRTIISACTSLLSQPQPEDQQSEISVPPELDYASVEPVLRFVYSGRLNIRGSKKQLSAIYIASQKLQVSLLTRLIDRRFPHLLTNKQNSTKHHMVKRIDKVYKHPKLRNGGVNPKSIGVISSFTGESSSSGRQKRKVLRRTEENADGSISNESAEEERNKGGEEEEEEESNQDSVYFLVTNSQKIAQANAAVRRKRPAEPPRPTRFELEDESENSSVKIATWSSKSSIPPYYSSSSNDNSECSSSVSTPVLDSTVSVSSPNSSIFKNTNVTWSSGSVSSASSSNVNKGFGNAQSTSQSQNSFGALAQSTSETISSSSSEQSLNGKFNLNPLCKSSAIDMGGDDKNMEEEDAGKESDELMEKISNICRQLEDGDSDENGETSAEEPSSSKISMTMGSSQGSEDDDDSESSDCIILDNSSSATKSILKKRKETNSVKKKRVSFPLDENNELINEVATYSNSKEPSQSLIDVQKTVGSLRSSVDSSSPVKLTLSLKKKVLMNLTLEDGVSNESLSDLEGQRAKSKKTGVSATRQSTSQGVNQGDLSNHAKIISEVLKKYPHLVKDRKNIRLKILKKGNDKTSSGKLVKSKVQYLVLSENEPKGKSSTKHEKSNASVSKSSVNSSTHATSNTQKFNCSECDNLSFPSYYSFKKHVTSEHKEKSSAIIGSIENVPYACYTCYLDEPLEFTDYCSYQQHMREVHSKREAMLCSMCGYRPRRKIQLAYHQYIEHNKIPRNVTFPKCDLCDHVAMNDAALLKHRSQHANADNYTCSVCGVAFRSFGALQGHMQTKLCQSKPTVCHKCPYCPQTFARSYNLKAHCKSNHRAAHLAAQAATNSANENRAALESVTESDTNAKKDEGNDSSNAEGGLVEQVCESLTSISNNQSSSEAEALSTVANSLAASLGLPEETVNHYMYTQGSKMDFATELDNSKYGEAVARSNVDSTQLIEPVASGSGFTENLPLCQDGTFTSQASISTTTAAANVGTFYPVSVVPGQFVPGQIVSGELLQSQMLSGTCVNVAGSPILGAPSHGWTYVAYQVPSCDEDIQSVMTDPSNLSGVDADQIKDSGEEIPLERNTTSREDSDGNNANVVQEEDTDPLVLITDSTTQVSVSPASHISTSQTYDAFSSQFVHFEK